MKTNKNDDHDAEAIAEAATHPTMRFVPVKSEAQSDIQALHRARSRLAAERRALINHLRAEWRSLDERTAAFDAGCVRMVRDDGMSRRLSTILSIGVVNATALVAAVGDAASFGRGGDLAAWLGLTPRQATTGGKTQAAGHIQARQPLPARKPDPWYSRSPAAHHGSRYAVRSLGPGSVERAHKSIIVVSLATKLARIVWAVLRKECSFDPAIAAA